MARNNIFKDKTNLKNDKTKHMKSVIILQFYENTLALSNKPLSYWTLF